MKDELLNKEVLAMYDVRGIQDYVFKTNAVKEIIGASVIIDDIILGAFKEYAKDKDSNLYHTNWKNDSDDAFIKEGSNVLMQVMFIGGGNAYVLFRSGEECKKVNHFVGKYVLEHTYSLNLAVVVVEKTNSYSDDYHKINIEMRKIKACMPNTMPVGAFPFMNADSITGYPITNKFYRSENPDFLCKESYLKMNASKEDKDNEGEKVLDNLVTKKGEDSTLALVHMDGNSMGTRIMNLMKGVKDYLDAIKKMRNLSRGIDDAYKNAFDKMCSTINEKSGGKWCRKIVLAGDDITFICNAGWALDAAKLYIKELNKVKADFMGDPNGVLSACVGIAYCNSHFPFSDAYKTAEACLSNAKSKAKEEKRRNGDRVGNFIDFQLCSNINSANLDDYREKHYMVDGESFIRRPYYLDVENDFGLNKLNRDCSFTLFEEKINKLAKENLPRSLSKEIRSVIPGGDNEIKKEIGFLKSRNHDFDDLLDGKDIYYDALELIDFKKGDRHEN